MADTGFTVRGMRGSDLAGVCDVARAALVADPVTPELFARKVFLDLNFDPRGSLVAESGGRVAGFITGFVRRYPIEDMADDSDRSWITLFAVHPDFQRRGIGSALFDAVEGWFRQEGKSAVLAGPYTPNWWIPGVDVNAYPGAVEFLKSRGYEEVTRPLAMDSDLVSYRRPQWVSEKQAALEAAGVKFRQLCPELVPDLFAFLKAEFPGDWQRHLRETVTRILRNEYPPRHVHVAIENGAVRGFAHFEGERFGPFGTARPERGRGMGAVLLCLTVEAMRDSGLHDAFFLWTADSTAKLYAEAGFRESRRFCLMKKALG